MAREPRIVFFFLRSLLTRHVTILLFPRFSPLTRNCRSVRPRTKFTNFVSAESRSNESKKNKYSRHLFTLFDFAALPHDDWCHRVHPVYPHTGTVHARRRSSSRSHHIDHDIRDRHSDVRAGHVWMQVPFTNHNN